MDYALHVLILIGLYVTFAVSLDIVVGEAGLLSIAHGAFASLGAYSTAILTIKAGWPALAALGAGVLLAAGSSLGVAFASLRLRGDYFALATFGFHVIVYRVLDNWVSVTGGPLGITGIKPLFGRLGGQVGMAMITTLVAAGAIASLRRVRQSSFTRALRVARQDDAFAQAIGKSVISLRCQAVALSAGIAALTGSLYAHYLSFIDASSFAVMESVMMLAMVAAGGAGSVWGPPVGAALVVLLPEILRGVGFPSAEAATLRRLAFGILLVAVIRLRPRGLLGGSGALE